MATASPALAVSPPEALVFEGSIADFQDPDGALRYRDPPSIREPISATVVVDPSTPDLHPEPRFGFFRSSPPSEVTVSLDSSFFEVPNEPLEMEVLDDRYDSVAEGIDGGDAVLFRSRGNLFGGLVDGGARLTGEVAVRFIDPEGLTIDSDELVLTPGTLQRFPIQEIRVWASPCTYATLVLCERIVPVGPVGFVYGVPDPAFVIRGSIEQIFVPEASEPALPLALAVFLGGRARRRLCPKDQDGRLAG